jgi:hypothetical protein
VARFSLKRWVDDVGGEGNGSMAFWGGGGVLVAGDGGDEVLQHDRTTGNEGRSPNGTISGDGVPPAADHRQKARGWSGAHTVLAKEKERWRKKGVGDISGALLKGSGGK